MENKSMAHISFETISLSVKGKELDSNLDRKLSEDLAADILSDPMLIAWFDGKKNE